MGNKLPDTIKGYRAIKLDRINPNRGSLMYVKKEYYKYYDKMVLITDPDDMKIGSEIIHILINTNIIGVYQETGITNDEADEAHKVLKNKVTKRVDLGEVCLVMGDMNAAINPSAKPYTKSAKNILDWEGTGEIRILNNKNKHTHIPDIKNHKKNCLDIRAR